MKFLIKFTICFLLVQVVKANAATCEDLKQDFEGLDNTPVTGANDDIIPEAYKATCDAANAFKLCKEDNTEDFNASCSTKFGANKASKFDCADNKCSVCYAEKKKFENGEKCGDAENLKACIDGDTKEVKLVFKDICKDDATCNDGSDKKNCTEVKAAVAPTTAATKNATASATASGTTAARTIAPTVSSTGEAPSEQGDTASGIELSMTLIGAAALLALARRPMLD